MRAEDERWLANAGTHLASAALCHRLQRRIRYPDECLWYNPLAARTEDILAIKEGRRDEP